MSNVTAYVLILIQCGSLTQQVTESLDFGLWIRVTEINLFLLWNKYNPLPPGFSFGLFYINELETSTTNGCPTTLMMETSEVCRSQVISHIHNVQLKGQIEMLLMANVRLLQHPEQVHTAV